MTRTDKQERKDLMPYLRLSCVLTHTTASYSIEMLSINAVLIAYFAVPAAGVAKWLGFSIHMTASNMMIMQLGPGHHQGLYQRPCTLTSYVQAG